jgi:hypothetical protein
MSLLTKKQGIAKGQHVPFRKSGSRPAADDGTGGETGARDETDARGETASPSADDGTCAEPYETYGGTYVET